MFLECVPAKPILSVGLSGVPGDGFSRLPHFKGLPRHGGSGGEAIASDVSFLFVSVVDEVKEDGMVPALRRGDQGDITGVLVCAIFELGIFDVGPFELLCVDEAWGLGGHFTFFFIDGVVAVHDVNFDNEVFFTEDRLVRREPEGTGELGDIFVETYPSNGFDHGNRDETDQQEQNQGDDD